MKFKDIILEARYRLHDIRKKDGTLITLPEENGVRWTSALLCIIAKSALIEMSRTLIANKLENNLAYNINSHLVSAKLKTGALDGYVEFDKDYSYYKVMSIQEKDSKSIYRYCTDEEFFSFRWKNAENPDEGIESIGRKVFTTVYDADNKKPKILVLPIPAEDIDVEIALKVPLESLFSITSDVDLPFINSMDLVYDFIIKVAYQIEYSLPQQQLYEQIIAKKIGEMKVEV